MTQKPKKTHKSSISIASFVETGWFILTLLLFVYSYTQVDLGLTIAHVSFWQKIQQSLQYVGYFIRPESTIFYIGITMGFFVWYLVTIYLVKTSQYSGKRIVRTFIMMALFLLISYPAFSKDMFNYMFTAKTVLIYHKNPYQVIPLQFAGIDPWLGFMNWTHLPSAYTPLWILVTLPAYLLGFGYLLLIMWNIKAIAVISYVFTIIGIRKVMGLYDSSKSDLAVALYAFNPLVVYETLVSGHNDSMMMALVIAAVYFLKKNQFLKSWIFWSLSVAAKLMTVFLLPMFLFRHNRILMLVSMSLAFIAVQFQREVLPWYFLWVIPFVALIPEYTSIVLISTGVSLGLLLRYAPYLYYGHWNDPVPTIKTYVTVIPVIIVLGIVGIRYILLTRKHPRIPLMD